MGTVLNIRPKSELKSFGNRTTTCFQYGHTNHIMYYVRIQVFYSFPNETIHEFNGS